MKSKEMALGGLLTAFAIIIPLAFGGVLGITIPPFSATLASHVPVMLAMVVSPVVGIMVGLGSALGFLIRLGPVIAARAATHAVWAGFGGVLYRRGMPLRTVLILMLPVHALLEAFVVVLVADFTLIHALYLIGIGTALHHAMDSVITLGLYHSMQSLFGRKVLSVKKAQREGEVSP